MIKSKIKIKRGPASSDFGAASTLSPFWSREPVRNQSERLEFAETPNGHEWTLIEIGDHELHSGRCRRRKACVSLWRDINMAERAMLLDFTRRVAWGYRGRSEKVRTV